MAPDDQSGARPAGPVVLRIKLRYDDLDAMVQRFASNVGKSGLFLPTKTIQPIGTEVKFELRLANDTPVLVGLGRVKHVRPPDPANPKAAFGMAIELMRVSREGREVIIRMIERRRAMGLPEVAIPLPEDIDAAKRADLDTQPRADTSGIVREAMAQMASAPVAEQILTARPTTGPIATARLETAPVPLAKEPAPAPERPTPLPRPSTGPIAGPRESGPFVRPALAVLAPEPARARRPRVHELIARASESGPVLAAAPSELDMHVDLDHVLARARALAGGELDAELDLLREAAAAPIEISVEAASAELARQLGGNAISRRDRSAGWAPPPVVQTPAQEPARPVEAKAEPSPPEVKSEPAPVEANAEPEPAPAEPVVAPAAADTKVEPVSAEVAAEPAPVEEPPEPAPGAALDAGEDDDDDAFGEDAPGASTAIDPEVLRHAQRESSRPRDIDGAFDRASSEGVAEPEAPRSRPGTRPPAMVVEDDPELAAFERALDGAIIRTGLTKPAPPADDNDEDAEELDSLDLEPDDDEEPEHTQIGGMPVDPSAFQQHGYPTVPDQLAERLDEQLAAAEAEADAEVGGAIREGAYEQGAYAEPGYAEPGYAEPAYAEPAAYGEPAPAYPEQPAYDQGAYDQGAYPEQAAYPQGDYEQGAYPEHAQYGEQPAYDPAAYGEEQAEGSEEISDFDVLAEADAEDADLLSAHGEQEASGEVPAARPSEGSFDFAARLDLGDDPSRQHALPAEPPMHEQGGYDAGGGYDQGAGYNESGQYNQGYDSGGRYDQGGGYGQAADPRRARSYGDGYEDGPPAYADARRPPSYSDYDAPSSSYTFAETFPPRAAPYEDAQDPYGENAPAQLTPIASPPVGKQPTMLRQPPADDLDLESALEALDVDLDELGGPVEGGRPGLPGMPAARAQREPPQRLSEAETQRPGARAKSRPGGAVRPSHSKAQPGADKAAAKAKRKATEDDGVLIDFDDDD